jgi:hypothetical protein
MPQTINSLPKLNMKDNPTGCCPRFVPKDWDNKTFIFKDKKFVKAVSRSFLYMPLNLGSVITKVWNSIMAAGADDKAGEFAVLSYDLSPWKCEHFFTVTKKVSDLENVTTSGTFKTKVFEGPYQDAPKWIAEMKGYKKVYLYYTTCPKCGKYWGKNYVVAFGQVI